MRVIFVSSVSPFPNVHTEFSLKSSTIVISKKIVEVQVLFCSSEGHHESRLLLAATDHPNELRLCGLRSKFHATYLTPVLFALSLMAGRRSSQGPD
jgi:hypothetical protein